MRVQEVAGAVRARASAPGAASSALHKRWRRMAARGKPHQKIVVACARELSETAPFNRSGTPPGRLILGGGSAVAATRGHERLTLSDRKAPEMRQSALVAL